MALAEQEALETAVAKLLCLATGNGGLGYARNQCKVMFDGRPEPRCGSLFVSVWSDGGRQPGDSGRAALDQLFTVNVTVTERLTNPFDRWSEHRHDVHDRCAAIAACVNRDVLNYYVTNQAAILASFRSSAQSGSNLPVGWCEPLMWLGTDPGQPVGPDWFWAELEKADRLDVGYSQTVRFGRARRIQAIATAGPP